IIQGYYLIRVAFLEARLILCALEMISAQDRFAMVRPCREAAFQVFQVCAANVAFSHLSTCTSLFWNQWNSSRPNRRDSPTLWKRLRKLQSEHKQRKVVQNLRSFFIRIVRIQ